MVVRKRLVPTFRAPRLGLLNCIHVVLIAGVENQVGMG
jgi:hypothetical protein